MPITALGGLHSGCFELFAHEPIRTISDLKGKKVGIQTRLGPTCSRDHGGARRARPAEDIDWVDEPPTGELHGAVRRGKVDAFLGFPARAAGAARPQHRPRDPQHGHGQAMVAVFLLHAYGNSGLRPRSSGRHQARPARHPQGRRLLRRPSRSGPRDVWSMAGSRSVRLRAPDADRASIPAWREFDPEDTLRFYALRLHEAGMIKSSPNALLAEGTDWRFLNELKRELKA